MVHQDVIGLDKGVIPFGFLLSIIFLIIGAIGGKGQTQYRFPI